MLGLNFAFPLAAAAVCGVIRYGEPQPPRKSLAVEVFRNLALKVPAVWLGTQEIPDHCLDMLNEYGTVDEGCDPYFEDERAYQEEKYPHIWDGIRSIEITLSSPDPSSSSSSFSSSLNSWDEYLRYRQEAVDYVCHPREDRIEALLYLLDQSIKPFLPTTNKEDEDEQYYAKQPNPYELYSWHGLEFPPREESCVKVVVVPPTPVPVPSHHDNPAEDTTSDSQPPPPPQNKIVHKICAYSQVRTFPLGARLTTRSHQFVLIPASPAIMNSVARIPQPPAKTKPFVPDVVPSWGWQPPAVWNWYEIRFDHESDGDDDDVNDDDEEYYYRGYDDRREVKRVWLSGPWASSQNRWGQQTSFGWPTRRQQQNEFIKYVINNDNYNWWGRLKREVNEKLRQWRSLRSGGSGGAKNENVANKKRKPKGQKKKKEVVIKRGTRVMSEDLPILMVDREAAASLLLPSPPSGRAPGGGGGSEKELERLVTESMRGALPDSELDDLFGLYPEVKTGSAASSDVGDYDKGREKGGKGGGGGRGRGGGEYGRREYKIWKWYGIDVKLNLGEGGEERVFKTVFQYASRVGRSENPNLEYRFDQKTLTLSLFATRDIRRDEELTIGY